MSAVDTMMKKNEDLHIRQMCHINLEAKKLELEEHCLALEEKKLLAWEHFQMANPSMAPPFPMPIGNPMQGMHTQQQQSVSTVTLQGEEYHERMVQFHDL